MCKQFTLKYNKDTMKHAIINCGNLTLVAHSKQVVTTLEITFIRFFVSCITLSTLVNVAAFPTVWSLTVNCNLCTKVGTLSRCSRSSFLFDPPGTLKIKNDPIRHLHRKYQRNKYLVTKLSNNLIQSVRLFSKILGLCKKILCCL